MGILRRESAAQLDAYTKASTVRTPTGYSADVNKSTNTIFGVLADKNRVSETRTTPAEKEEILKVVIASALTDLTYDATNQLSPVESIRNRTHKNLKPTSVDPASTRHFTILQDMDRLSRAIVNLLNDGDLTVTATMLGSDQDDLFTFSGLTTGQVAGWFNQVFASHKAGLNLVKLAHENAMHATARQDPRQIVIQKLNDGSFIYATAGIMPSNLHEGVGFAQYPNLMSLGIAGIPTMAQTNTFSIAVEVRPNAYLIIMKPRSARNNLLLPIYGEVPADITRGAPARGVVTVEVQSGNGVALPNRTINWNTATPTNEGALNYPIYDEDEVFGGDATYSFNASVTGSRTGNKKYYYWCPTNEQMSLLKAYATKTHGFTLQGLFDEINNDYKYEIDQGMLQEIDRFIHGK